MKRPAHPNGSGHHPIRVGVIGMGGYAARHHEALLALEATGEARLVCTCDPAEKNLRRPGDPWNLEARGVAVWRDYREMLDAHAEGLDMVTIPTPIPLHAEMHAEVVGRGLAAYLEKPPTLDPAELEQMIARDAMAPVPTLVGFNFIEEPLRRQIKKRLLDGEFGRLVSVRFFGWWPRSVTYYQRADWTGRLRGDDNRLILDSGLGNGFAHYVHNLLHWSGDGAADEWASPLRVRAGLWRAHPIQSADTAFVSAETDTNVAVRIALSHACRGPEVQWEALECTDADIRYVSNKQASINWRDGRRELIPLSGFDGQVENLRALFACLHGRRDRPPTTLADSRPFVHLHAMAYVSSGRIRSFDPDRLRTGEGGYLEVSDLLTDSAQFLDEGKWPEEEPPVVTPGEIARLDQVIHQMESEADSRIPEQHQNTTNLLLS